jgi:hypothetical protein
MVLRISKYQTWGWKDFASLKTSIADCTNECGEMYATYLPRCSLLGIPSGVALPNRLKHIILKHNIYLMFLSINRQDSENSH